MSNITLLTEDTDDISSASPATWGLLNADGSNALTPDSSFSFEFQQEWKIANYPLENGAFASYDKVISPYTIEYVAMKGGSEADRVEFLANATIVAGSTNIYTFVTPEASFPTCNVAKWHYARTAQNGLTLLKVFFSIVQINLTGIGTVTTTASPNGAAQSNGGTVQPSQPTPPQSGAISNAGPPQPPETGFA